MALCYPLGSGVSRAHPGGKQENGPLRQLQQPLGWVTSLEGYVIVVDIERETS